MLLVRSAIHSVRTEPLPLGNGGREIGGSDGAEKEEPRRASTTFYCGAQGPYSAKVVYCNGGADNWQGTLKFVDGGRPVALIRLRGDFGEDEGLCDQGWFHGYDSWWD